MREEYSIGDDNCPYSWLNEWLCEYVDGTMDPSLRRVFDKYVQANPELKAHVERLRHTRELLCRCSRMTQQEAPDAVRVRVQEKVECDLLRTPSSLRDAVRERPVAAFTSTLVVALVVGVFAGAVLFAPDTLPAYSTRTAETAPQFEERAPIPGRAATLPGRRNTRAALTSRGPNPSSMDVFTGYEAGMPYVPALDSSASPLVWRMAAARP